MLLRYAFFIFLTQALYAEIIIRPALEDDLEGVMQLDREVSWEYFKPLFLEYTGLPLAENPDALLEEELVPDREMFIKGINHVDGNRLYIACDDNTIIGFVAFCKEQTTVNIDLLCVHKDYRNKKIGRRLLDVALTTFNDIDTCTLVVLDKNISARKLYESYGFVLQEMPEDLKQHFPSEYAHIYLFYTLNIRKPNAHWDILYYFDSSDGLSQAAIKNITDLVRGYNENPDKDALNIYIQLHCLDQDGSIGDGPIGPEAYRYRVTPQGLVVCKSAHLSYDCTQDLIDAARWAFEKSTAQHTMIIFSDHGGGIIDPIWHETECGGHWDAQEDALMILHKSKKNRQHYKALMMMREPRVYLSINELDKALSIITHDILPQKKFDIIGMDMCLMSLLEVTWTVAPYGKLYIASQDASSSYGWDYYQLFKNITHTMHARDLADTVVTTYDQFYSALGSDEHTLAVVDLTKIDTVKNSFEKVCESLLKCITLYGNALVHDIKTLRPQLYCFHLVPMYTDLHQFYTHLLELLAGYEQTTEKEQLITRIKHAQNAIEQSVWARCAGSKRSETRGLSIYFPLSHMDTSYPKSLFAQSSLWPEIINTIITL